MRVASILKYLHLVITCQIYEFDLHKLLQEWRILQVSPMNNSGKTRGGDNFILGEGDWLVAKVFFHCSRTVMALERQRSLKSRLGVEITVSI